jgi:HD-GYP domain-containing protein (c-di-GMP phosphodiesterase class II)/putative methionine-R-sulfoxide reductase with GAF domain
LLEESSGDWVSPGWLDSEGRWVTSQDASLRHRPGEGVTGRVGSSGEIYITADLRTDPVTKPLPGEAEFLANFISAISLPLHAEQHIIGVLHVWFSDSHTFTESEQRLLNAIADMAGNALQRASLHQETQRRAEETSALLETSQAITLLDLGSVLQTIGERAKVLFAADGCRIFLLEPDGETLSCALALHERAEAVMRMHIKVGEGITGSVAASGEAEIVNDTLNDRRSLHVPGTPQDENECLMLVPLKAQERVIGVMSVSRLGIERPFQPAELELLRAMAAQASVAIENARLYKETQGRLQQLAALHTIDRTISTSLDLRMTLRVIAEQAAAQLKADAAAVLLLDQRALTLEYAAGYGFRQRGIEQSRVPLGTGLAGRAAIKRCTLSAPHLSHEDSSSLLEGVLVGEGFLAHHVTPLIAKGEVKGVLEVYHRAAFTPQVEWIKFFETIAIQAAIAIDNAQLFDSLQRSSLELSLAYSATIEGWAKAMEMRDKETEGHTLRVTELTLQLAQIMKVPDGDIIHIRRGALLHDIGKIGVPDSILRKPGKLSAEEWEIMRRHPQSAYEMLQPIEFLRLALDIPYCHHEKWDGSGYPRGLKGEQIPIAARIFAIADVFDALTSERPYRPAWSREKALAYIREQSGKHFDPQVVRAFLSLIEKT